MNAYGLIVILICTLIFCTVYELGPAIHKFVSAIADIPSINIDSIRDPYKRGVFALAIRLGYILAILGLVSLCLKRKD